MQVRRGWRERWELELASGEAEIATVCNATALSHMSQILSEFFSPLISLGFLHLTLYSPCIDSWTVG